MGNAPIQTERFVMNNKQLSKLIVEIFNASAALGLQGDAE